jgi:rhodanese-related sulfurtransferase
VDKHTDVLPTDKATPVAVYCTGGGRSSSAAKKLVDLGYTDVLHLQGGITAWKKAGYAIE